MTEPQSNTAIHAPKETAIFKDSAEHWLLFRKKRFALAGDGEFVVIRNIDLSGYELRDFPANSLAFVECNLDDTSFNGTEFLRTVFLNCSMKNADLSETLATSPLFVGCDLTGIKVSALKPYSSWVSEDLDGKNMPAVFDACELDSATKNFLVAEGCEFKSADQPVIELVKTAPVLDI